MFNVLDVKASLGLELERLQQIPAWLGSFPVIIHHHGSFGFSRVKMMDDGWTRSEGFRARYSRF